MEDQNEEILTSTTENNTIIEEPLIWSYYINACFPPPSPPTDDLPTPIPTPNHPQQPTTPWQSSNTNIPPTTASQRSQLSGQALRDAFTNLGLDGRWRIISTRRGGLVVAFSRLDEANETFEKIGLAKILSGPVQVATLPQIRHHSILSLNNSNNNINNNLGKFSQGSLSSQFLVIRDVPWSIPVDDMRLALEIQGVQASSSERWRQHVRIEVKNPAQSNFLLSEGLDFYGAARFLVTLERGAYSQAGDHSHSNQSTDISTDVLQCYRCQGFWHVAVNCRHLPRCVRCGEPHGVEYCMRPRNNPLCCNCSGSHHAAYKFCPVRKQMAQSIPIFFTLSKKRPIQSSAPISPNTISDKARCLL